MKVEHNAEYRFVTERSRFFAVIFAAADEDRRLAVTP